MVRAAGRLDEAVALELDAIPRLGVAEILSAFVGFAGGVLGHGVEPVALVGNLSHEVADASGRVDASCVQVIVGIRERGNDRRLAAWSKPLQFVNVHEIFQIVGIVRGRNSLAHIANGGSGRHHSGFYRRLHMTAPLQPLPQDAFIATLEQAEGLPLVEKIEAIRVALLMRAKLERDAHQADWGYFGAGDGSASA